MRPLVRLAKAQMLAFFGLFMLLAAFTNIEDYDANFAYVTHVLSMDTTFKHPEVMWRAISSTRSHRAAYAVIIAWEAAAGAFCVLGVAQLLRAVRARQSEFERAKITGAIGLMLALSLWTIGFVAVGGEWFLMWQSAIWNGDDVATRLAILTLLTLAWLVAPEPQVDDGTR